MTDQRDDAGEVSAGQGQESLGGRGRTWPADYADKIDPRHEDGGADPQSARREGPKTDISTDPEPPAGV